MQLRILRRESKGMLGGLSFEYSIKIMPNQQELELIQKYKMDREVIYQMERQLLGQKWEVTFTVGDFIRGKNVKNKNLAELIALENAVVEGCEVMKILLNAMSKIDIEEVIEI